MPLQTAPSGSIRQWIGVDRIYRQARAAGHDG
jgi:hypothetical protein